MIIFAAEVRRRSSLGAVNNDNQPPVKPWSPDTHRNQIRQFGGRMMDKNEIIERLEMLTKHAIHTVGELPFVMSLDDGIAIHEAIDMLRSQPEPHWIQCSERLPEEYVYVLVWCGEVRIARLIRGISKEQRAKMQEGTIDDPVSYGWNLSNGYFKVKRSESYRACDEIGNNEVPYCWDCIYGEMFGQDVKAWMPLPEPYKGGKDV